MSCAQLTDAEVVAELTTERPLSRYCVVAGSLRTWARLQQPSGDIWLPLTLLIDDNRLALAAPDAMLRAGVQSFHSDSEAAEWARTHNWSELSS